MNPDGFHGIPSGAKNGWTKTMPENSGTIGKPVWHLFSEYLNIFKNPNSNPGILHAHVPGWVLGCSQGDGDCFARLHLHCQKRDPHRALTVFPVWTRRVGAFVCPGLSRRHAGGERKESELPGKTSCG
jgi:hypothetical protein